MNYDKWSLLVGQLKSIHKSYEKIMIKILNGMTVEQGRMLWILHKNEMTQRELAKRLRISEATLSVRVKKMVESGLLERIVDENDKRIYHLTLSQKGKEIVTEIKESMLYHQKIVCQGITEQEYQAIQSAINKMERNIKEEMS